MEPGALSGVWSLRLSYWGSFWETAVSKGKKINSPQADQVHVTLDIMPAPGQSPQWDRLWRLLLSPAPGPSGQGVSESGKSTDVEQNAEAAG